MAVRGVYTAEEEAVIANFKKKAETGVFWVGDEPSQKLIYPVGHRVVTKELILGSVKGMGDRNPLYSDEGYARKTRWGGIIAPPLMPFIICEYGPEQDLDLPPELGSFYEFTAGYTCEFYKPIRVGDSFKVRDGVPRLIEDVTRSDGTGPRTFQITKGRQYINQNDEIVCIIYNRRLAVITPPGKEKEPQPVLQLLPMSEYKYTKEELAFIDDVYDGEEIRGDEPRYWEDVNPGDELTPIVIGPITIWDLIIQAGSYSTSIGNVRDLREKTPQKLIVDPVTNVAHNNIEIHFVDRIAQVMGGGTIAVIFTGSVNESLCRVVSNWMGDDGSLKSFESHHWTIIPVGDTYFCKGKVIKKRFEKGEYLVDLAVWAEDIRGYTAMWGTATVKLLSRQELIQEATIRRQH